MTPTTPVDKPRAQGQREASQRCSTRREFIKRGAGALGASVATLVICDLTELARGMQPTTRPAEKYDWNKYSYVYLIDTRKCIGCGACVRACARENDVPPHYFRTWVERYHIPGMDEPLVDSPNGGMDGFEPSVAGHEATKAFFFPKLCCHCTHTPCVQLCPVGASYRTKDGVVLVDEQRCIGCGYCVQACPYGSRFIHPQTHVASKCTLCYHRLRRGLTTACIGACPVGARRLGNARDPRDEVARIIATEPVQILQPDLLTDPNCYYLGLSSEAR